MIKRATRMVGIFVGLVLLLLCGPLLVLVSGTIDLSARWSSASREPAGLAPDPAESPDAVVQVYGARAFSWRGAFAVHTWIAVKAENADSFTTYEVLGWRARRGISVVATSNGRPDRAWYGQPPELYADIRGPEASALIPQIQAAVRSYPYGDTYGIWPGPNSNTFTAHVARLVPGLRLDLPPTAVGKDYLGAWRLWASSPSGTGFQISARGLAGVMVGIEEGLELNLLGLSFGVDPVDLAIRLPGIGVLGAGSGRAIAASPDEEG